MTLITYNDLIYSNEKAAKYMCGKVYLTSHRIIYVDSEKPNTNSIGVEIRLLKGREFYVRNLFFFNFSLKKKFFLQKKFFFQL